MAQRTVTRRLAVAAAVVVGVASLGVPASAQGSGPDDDPGLISETTTGFIGETEKNVAADPLGLKVGIDRLAALLRGTVILQTLAGNDNEWRYSASFSYPDFLDVQLIGDEALSLRGDEAFPLLGGPDTPTRLGAEVQAFMDQANPLAELRNLFAEFKSLSGMDSETEVSDLHGYGTVAGLRDVLAFSEVKDLVMSIGAHGLGIMPGDNITQAVWKAPAGLEPPGVTDSHDRYANQEVAYATEYLAPGVYIEETSFYQDMMANEHFLEVAAVETAIPAFMYTFWLQSAVATILADWLDAHQQGFIIHELEKRGFKVEIEGVTQGAFELRSALEPWTDVAGFCGNVLDACPNITAMFDEADAIFGKRTNIAIDHVGAGFLPTGETAIFSSLIGALDAAVDALNVIIDHIDAGLIELDPTRGIIILDQDGETEVADYRTVIDRERTTSRTREAGEEPTRDRDRSGDGTGDRTTTTTAPPRSTTTTAPPRSTTTTAPPRSTTTTAPPRSTTTTAPPRSTTTTAPPRSTTTTSERSTTTTESR